MKRLSVMLLAVGLMLTGTAWAGDKIYKTWEFGIDRSEILAMEGVQDCSDDLGEGALCLPNDTLFGLDWSMAVKFFKSKLAQVILIGQYSEERYYTTAQSLNKAMALVALQNQAGELLDLIQTFKVMDQAQATQKISQFEQTCKSQGHIKYVYLSKKELSKLPGKSGSMAELVTKSPETLREVDLVVTDEGVVLSFTLPKQALKLTSGSGKVESF